MIQRNTRPLALAALGLAAGLALGGCKQSKTDERITEGGPTAASSEYVAPNPTEPAVPVTLPDTTANGAPAASPTPSAAAK